MEGGDCRYDSQGGQALVRSNLLQAGLAYIGCWEGNGGQGSQALEWIALSLNFLAAGQSGFHCHRSAAEIIFDVVTALEDAKLRGHAGYSVLLHIKSAFGILPHAAVLHALRAMGVCGRLLGYVEELLGGRTFRVHIAGDLSMPRPSTAGVPQSSI
ncbi:uncharacterized protein LOC142803209 [Rhipicephalus microplus]|uniref:uncharacterized protein LOC142803209 n=1 Tax=Rhipicephalus microplus TaxID=6941 RepID=UPI003F6D9428